MLKVASRALLVLAVMGLFVGAYQVTDGTVAAGRYLLAASLGLLVAGAALEGLDRIAAALESIMRELRQMRRK